MYLQRLLVPAGLVLAALAAIVSPASAKQPECKAINQSQNLTYNSNRNASPLGAAISAAASGDTIKVMGTCYGNFAITKDLTLEGRPSEKQTDVINGGGSGTVLGITGSLRVTLVDLTITGGTTGVVNTGATLSLIRAKVTGNGGRGIEDNFAISTTIEDSVVSDNGGWGIWNGRGVVSISDSQVTGNSGGGITIFHGGLTLTGSHVASNTGGSGISTAGGTFISNSVIERNMTEGVGGGIESVELARVEITDSTVRGNTASQGGGIYNHFMTFGDVTITDSVITGNRATGGAGGVPGNGGGIYNGERLSLVHSSVIGNMASAAGGGIFNGGSIFNSERLSLTDSSVTGNSAGTVGGGIFNSGTVALNGTNSLCPNSPNDWPSCLP